MNIYEKINQISDETGSFDEKMYKVLLSEKYDGKGYQKQSLDEGMEIINQVIWG